MNDKIKKLCLGFDGYLSRSSSGTQITWHALQFRSSGDITKKTYQQEMRSEAGHPTPEAAIAACLASKWEVCHDDKKVS
jgi:hypothetical protein